MTFQVKDNILQDGNDFLEDNWDLIKKCADDFYKMTNKYKSFYATVFFNEKNRKIALFFCYGKLTKINVDLLDETKEGKQEEWVKTNVIIG